MGLRYVGHGNWLDGIPARDLTDEEVAQHGGETALLASGLYERDVNPLSDRGTWDTALPEIDQNADDTDD
jgi:hypothetical protein